MARNPSLFHCMPQKRIIYSNKTISSDTLIEVILAINLIEQSIPDNRVFRITDVRIIGVILYLVHTYNHIPMGVEIAECLLK